MQKKYRFDLTRMYYILYSIFQSATLYLEYTLTTTAFSANAMTKIKYFQTIYGFVCNFYHGRYELLMT